MKTALITGISGQDGSYLANLLLQKEYQIVGMLRYHGLSQHYPGLKDISDKIHFVHGDILDFINLSTILEHFKPDEIYNLAAPSYGPLSWDMPTYAMDVIALGPIRLMEAMVEKCPKARLYQASSSEMFGKPETGPQTEKTPLRPEYPYAIGKAAAHHAVAAYRQKYGLYAVSGIAYNHESPLRPDWFVTRKIARAAAQIKAGFQDKIVLGNLETLRDWHYAGDTVQAMWLSLQQDIPDDYVIASGEAHTVFNILEIAFGYLGLNWKSHHMTDPNLLRPAEPHHLVGDSSKIRDLGWRPQVDFKEMIEMMVQADVETINVG